MFNANKKTRRKRQNTFPSPYKGTLCPKQTVQRCQKGHTAGWEEKLAALDQLAVFWMRSISFRLVSTRTSKQTCNQQKFIISLAEGHGCPRVRSNPPPLSLPPHWVQVNSAEILITAESLLQQHCPRTVPPNRSTVTEKVKVCEKEGRVEERRTGKHDSWSLRPLQTLLKRNDGKSTYRRSSRSTPVPPSSQRWSRGEERMWRSNNLHRFSSRSMRPVLQTGLQVHQLRRGIIRLSASTHVTRREDGQHARTKINHSQKQTHVSVPCSFSVSTKYCNRLAHFHTPAPSLSLTRSLLHSLALTWKAGRLAWQTESHKQTADSRAAAGTLQRRQKDKAAISSIWVHPGPGLDVPSTT